MKAILEALEANGIAYELRNGDIVLTEVKDSFSQVIYLGNNIRYAGFYFGYDAIDELIKRVTR